MAKKYVFAMLIEILIAKNVNIKDQVVLNPPPKK